MIRFVTGIDTDIGKTIVVGLLGRYMASQGLSVITQKIAQTGSESPASDILAHRKIMGLSITEDDLSGDTCPYVFPFAASPHLAARKAGVEILPERITEATEALAGKYESVIVEGVGGLHVPLSDKMTVLDYLATMKYPAVLVTSSRLGSINHTLMSLELLRSRGIPLAGLVYNRFGEEDEEIGDDSRTVFERALKGHQYPVNIVDLWSFDEGSETPDFSALCMPEMG